MLPIPDPHLPTTVLPPAEPLANSTLDLTGAYHPAPGTEPASSGTVADLPAIPGYEITGEIARGGMGRVLAGRELALDREVAIKVLLPKANATRFVTESKITAKLPHPNIPPVHALGTLADGSPYLAMKLIRGRTLAAVFGDRPDVSADLPRFVQIFEQMAQATGFAHARGIVHRDLKPLNVMVGEFGEVQVMDWGLARDVGNGEISTRNEDGLAATQQEAGETRVGAVMGTAAYMPPEQARGEAVDAPADVFALGATLMEILTGERPWGDGPSVVVVARAARALLTDCHETLANCQADSELVAVARKCLSADATDRYPDGRAVAFAVSAYRAGVEARLRQAETDRARAETRASEQAKRRRVVQRAGGVIAAVLLIGMAVSLWQMNRAVDAEGLAKTNEKTATDERDAKDVALTEKSAALLAKTKALNEKEVALAAETKALNEKTAALGQTRTALRSLTDEIVENQMARGTTLTEENKEFIRTILKQYEALAAITGDDVESRSIRAEGLARVGLMRKRLGELKEAEAAYTDALALYQQLAADFPARPEVCQELARSHHNLGSLLQSTGRLKEAEAAYTDALALEKQLAADYPARPEVRQGLATSHINLGGLLLTTGRLKEAEAAYTAALALYKQLAADYPARPEVRQGLATNHISLGGLLETTGRLNEADEAYRDALAIRKQLVADFPTVPVFRQDLAISYVDLGVWLQTNGRPKEAEAAYNAALGISKQLAADYPTRPEFRKELARSYNNLGALLQASGRPEEAEAAFNTNLSICKRLAADFPTRPEFRLDLAASHNNLGAMLRATGRIKEAEAAYRDALALQQQLAADFPTRPVIRHDLVTSHHNLGVLLQTTGRLKEAEAVHRDALSLCKQLAADFPTVPEGREQLATSHNNLGRLLQTTGRLKEAEAAYRDALALRRQLAADFPTVLDHQIELGGNCCNFSNVLLGTGNAEESLTWFADAIAVLRQVLVANPRQHTARLYLRNSHVGRAQAYNRLEKYAEAIKDWDRTVELSPANEQQFFRAARANSRVRAGQMAEAVADADELTKLPGWNANRWYDFACIYAVAAVKDADKKAEYADRAMELLQKAVKVGYKDAAHVKKDSDLDPLRDRDDFKKLLADLEAKFPPPKELDPQPRPAK